MIPLVDDIDKDLLEDKWYIARDYWKRTSIKPHQTQWYLHRTILERILNRPLVKGEICDHVNKNKLDNRRSNLRLANHSLNAANVDKPITNKSGYKGVSYWKNTNRWKARIKYQQKHIYIGIFDTKEQAAIAYNKKAIELFGEYAHINVIDSQNE